MTTINTASAKAFRATIESATSKAEVSAALTQLDKAKDLSPSEKASLAVEAKDQLAAKSVGHGIDGAFKNFIESQGSPVGNKTPPMMARIGNALANSAKDIKGLVDDMANLATGAKGRGVDAGALADIKAKLEAANTELHGTSQNLDRVANDVAKGNDATITAGDIAAVSKALSGAQDDLGGVLDVLKNSGRDEASTALGGIAASLLRASQMAKNTKEIGEIVEEQVQTGKGGGVSTPSPFEAAPVLPMGDFKSLQPDATVLGRVTKDQLTFAESKMMQWHDTAAVSDTDVRVVRQTLGELFQLPRGQFLTLEKGTGDSALKSGHLITGQVKDGSGSVVGKFSGDLNTGHINISAVSVGKGV